MKKIINVALLMTALFIVSQSLSSGSTSAGLSVKVGLFLEPLNPFDDFQSFHLLIRKCAHFSEFAFYGGLVFASLSTKSLPKCFIWLLFLLPFVDEGIQLFVPARNGNLGDVFLDYSGIAFAFLCFQFWLRLKSRNAQTR